MKAPMENNLRDQIAAIIGRDSGYMSPLHMADNILALLPSPGEAPDSPSVPADAVPRCTDAVLIGRLLYLLDRVLDAIDSGPVIRQIKEDREVVAALERWRAQGKDSTEGPSSSSPVSPVDVDPDLTEVMAKVIHFYLPQGNGDWNSDETDQVYQARCRQAAAEIIRRVGAGAPGRDRV